MPTYDYRCKHCGHELEAFQQITAGPLRKCPACGRYGLERLIGAGAGIIFKGSGFYATDYRGSSSSPASTAKPSRSESEDSSSDKGSDAAAD